MDGITITIDSANIALLMFIIYKLVQLEYRIKRLEEKLIDRKQYLISR